MKISFALLAFSLAQEDAVANEENVAVEESADGVEEVEGADIARGMGPYGDYSYGSYEYYYDAQGRKKKKHKNKHTHPSHTHGHHYVADSHGSQNAWQNAMDYAAKGFGYVFDQDLIGNGRFCWNCFARLHYDPDTYQTSAAYDNCFEGGEHEGFMEMCVGEEYFCSWEERRYKGVIVAVKGGCKSAQACLVSMTHNYKYYVYNPANPVLTGDQCRAGNLGNNTQNSVCHWCCDAMPSNLNRFAPDNTMLCNHENFSLTGSPTSPAYQYKTESDGTDSFVWATDTSTSDLFAGLYAEGKYHGLFRIHDQKPFRAVNDATRYGPEPVTSTGLATNDMLRSHPREWTGDTKYQRDYNRFEH